MISKEKLEYGAMQVVDVCLRVKKGETTLVITDKETKHIGEAIANKMKASTGNCKLFVMEDFGKRSEDGVDPLKFPAEIDKMLREVDVSAYAAQGKKNEYASFRRPMLDAIDSNKKLRHAHLIGVNDAIMETGVAADYALIQKVNKKIYDIVTKAKTIHVTNPLGTDVTATFSPSMHWVNCDGDISKPGNWTNIPDGEVFTCPENINGVVVIDGELGDYMGKYGTLEKNPVRFELKDGRLANVTCSNKEIENEIKNYVKKDENANRIGEFAIGTNVALKKLVGNLLQDEKWPGIHIALGSPHAHKTGANWDSDVHLDVIPLNVTITVDGKQIMKDGKFTI